jgi:hypothetical protein
MAKSEAAAAPAPSPAPAAPAPSAPAPANAVSGIPVPKPEGKTVEDTTPVVRQYGRQYKTDFDDGGVEDGGGRDMPTVQDIDGAMPRGEEGTETVAEAVADIAAERTGMTKRTATPLEPEKPEGEAPAAEAKPDEAAATPAQPSQMTREERRALLAKLDSESQRRTEEQKVHADKERIAALEAKAKGSLEDRLSLVFPELAGKGEEARNRLIEMLVAGQVTLNENAPKPAAPSDEIAELRREIQELKGTAPNNPDNVAAARLRMVTTTMQQAGTTLPFTEREGDEAYALGVKIAKSMYAMQGNKGQVDGSRVMQVVEQHFEDRFVSKYGQAAADALKGRPTSAAPAAATAAAAAPVPAQRRPAGRRGAHAATGTGDHLPIDPARRHRAMMQEIDAMEGTVRQGPR